MLKVLLLKVRNAIKSFILCVDLKTMLLPLTLLSIKKLIILYSEKGVMMYGI